MASTDNPAGIFFPGPYRPPNSRVRSQDSIQAKTTGGIVKVNLKRGLKFHEYIL